MLSFALFQFVATAAADATFDKYLQQFDKVYTTEEYQERLALFQTRLAQIEAHNVAFDNGEVTHFQEINQFTDMTESEIARFRGYKRHNRHASLNAPVVSEPLMNVGDLPNSVDWRKQNAVTPVKNQGGCGSCWAFASTETLESHWMINHGSLPVLAPQQLVDCTPNPDHCGGTGGCEGATAELAYKYLTDIAKNGGLAAEASYPYTARDGTCRDSSVTAVASTTGFTKLSENNYTAVMNTVALEGPIAVAVDASHWSFYGGGIFDSCPISKNIDIDHLVQLVGYGVDAGTPYWLVRNSWGESWGERGYIRLKRYESADYCGEDNTPSDGSGCSDGPPTVKVCGNCGILYDTVVPIVGSLLN
jgi:cathepsin L